MFDELQKARSGNDEIICLMKTLENAISEKDLDLQKRRELSLRRLALRLEKRTRERGCVIGNSEDNDYLRCQLSEVSFRSLLAANGNVHYEDSSGCTVLHQAAASGRVEDIYILYKLGADVDACNSEGCSPVWSAAWKGHPLAVRALCECGASINKTDKDGWTPLYVACSSDQSDVVKCLLELGAQIDIRETDRRSSLYIAALMGHLDIVRMLCDGGADVDAADHNGWTPLWIAAKFCHGDVTRHLLTCGASVRDFCVQSCHLTEGEYLAVGVRGTIREVRRQLETQGVTGPVRVMSSNDDMYYAAYSLCNMMLYHRSLILSPSPTICSGQDANALSCLMHVLLQLHQRTPLRVIQHFRQYSYPYRRCLARLACSIHESLLQSNDLYCKSTEQAALNTISLHWCEILGLLADRNMLADLLHLRLVSVSCLKEMRFPVVSTVGSTPGTCRNFLEAHIIESWIALPVSRFLPTHVLGMSLRILRDITV